MTQEITDDTPIVMLTVGQLKECLGLTPDLIKKIQTLDENPSPESQKRYVRGIAGIASLFNVSYVTAFNLKNGILKPAVHQQGRIIIVDADMAIKLFEDHKRLKSVRGIK